MISTLKKFFMFCSTEDRNKIYKAIGYEYAVAKIGIAYRHVALACYSIFFANHIAILEGSVVAVIVADKVYLITGEKLRNVLGENFCNFLGIAISVSRNISVRILGIKYKKEVSRVTIKNDRNSTDY